LCLKLSYYVNGTKVAQINATSTTPLLKFAPPWCEPLLSACASGAVARKMAQVGSFGKM